MRIFYHHGFSFSDLYTNTPKTITDKNCSWFRKTYNLSGTLNDALSLPLKYVLGLIFKHIITNRVRFIVPYCRRSYIDFETICEEDFEIWRQGGGLQEIDFIESDFKGYILKYTYGTYKYQRDMRIYIGGDLKKLFIEKINSGVKFYTTEDVTLKYFISDVYKQFPQLSKKEIDKLLKQGFLRLNSVIKSRSAIALKSQKWFNWTAYFGELHYDEQKRFNQHVYLMERKLRKLDYWKKTPFDEYYYIAMHQKQFEEWVTLNNKARTLLTFKNVLAKKLIEECVHRYNPAYIFRFKRKKFRGYLHWIKEETIRDVTFMGYGIDRKFIATKWTWKQLIKEYEKGNSEYF